MEALKKILESMKKIKVGTVIPTLPLKKLDIRNVKASGVQGHTTN